MLNYKHLLVLWSVFYEFHVQRHGHCVCKGRACERRNLGVDADVDAKPILIKWIHAVTKVQEITFRMVN